jgi:DNA polymerase-3 subunit beta
VGLKIEISQPELAAVLAAVSGVVERRQTLPILANVLLETQENLVRVAATDLEIGVRTQAPCTVVEEGAVTVPARKLAELCRSLPPTSSVRIVRDGERCMVSSGRTRFKLMTLPAADFPDIAAEENPRSFSIPESQLRLLLDKTAFAMAQQDVRYYLNGVMLELGDGKLTAVATDGHRLSLSAAVLDAVPDQSEQMILPAKTVTELRRLLGDGEEPVAVKWGEHSIVVEAAGGVEIRSKLVDGKYPEYGRVIPRGLPRRALVSRDDLRTALQRAAILSNEKYKGVRIAFDTGVLSLQAQNPEHEIAEDEVSVDYEGDTVAIGFNVAYLLDVLQSISAERVEIGFQDADSSSIWRGESCVDETFVVMPMRL